MSKSQTVCKCPKCKLTFANIESYINHKRYAHIESQIKIRR